MKPCYLKHENVSSERHAFCITWSNTVAKAVSFDKSNTTLTELVLVGGPCCLSSILRSSWDSDRLRKRRELITVACLSSSVNRSFNSISRDKPGKLTLKQKRHKEYKDVDVLIFCKI